MSLLIKAVKEDQFDVERNNIYCTSASIYFPRMVSKIANNSTAPSLHYNNRDGFVKKHHLEQFVEAVEGQEKYEEASKWVDEAIRIIETQRVERAEEAWLKVVDGVEHLFIGEKDQGFERDCGAVKEFDPKLGYAEWSPTTDPEQMEDEAQAGPAPEVDGEEMVLDEGQSTPQGTKRAGEVERALPSKKQK